MNLHKHHESSCAILTVSCDRIDAANAVHIKDAFAAAIAAETGRIIMDLAAVSFMDSSGLGAMVASMKLIDNGRKLELCNLSQAVNKVFTLTRMYSVFEIHPDLETALADTSSLSDDVSAA
ncbi:MAG: STAS domain-containing protein [Litoreibacter sp.]